MAQREREAIRGEVFHFDPRLKRMTTLDREPGGALWYHAKGAPLELLERCTAIREREPGTGRSTRRRAPAVREAFERYAGEGMRVLGFAERRLEGRRRRSARGPRRASPSSA